MFAHQAVAALRAGVPHLKSPTKTVDLGAELPLDAEQVVAVLVRHERDGDAQVAEAARAAHAVQVGLRVLGEVKADDHVDALHVDAAREEVAGDQVPRGAVSEVVEDAVAVLLLPVLLAADWARARSGRSLTTYRVFGVLLVLLLMVVMASALQRLRIYIDVFGLTALRFYATALLAWLAAVFVWLLWSLLRERREQFVAGAVLAALVALVIVVAVNPHGTIASTNLSNAEAGRDFDVAHALGLSADATPTLLEGIDALGGDDACEVATVLQARWDEPDADLRAWNWGRASASDAVAADGASLAAACE